MRASLRDPSAAGRADLAACRALLRGGSRSFYAASWLLPRRVREPASALYAFCRLADDAVDTASGGADAVARLRQRLCRAYEGRPLPLPADRALAEVVARFAIPQALPEALLEGLEWDALGRRYADAGELSAYAARVAGAVGAMMAVLMGVRDPVALARACDLGIAMQLSNIARDVGEDARAGRIYLPTGWLRAAGIDPDAWLADPVFSPPLGAVVARLLGVADGLYRRSASGIGRLPRACRPGISAARLLYAEIGREVERRGFDSVSARAMVPARRRARLLAASLIASVRAVPEDLSPAVEEARFLVEAVAPMPSSASGLPAAQPAMPAGASLGDRIAWLLELFERLERREEVGSSRP
jgi:phytoene synthase